MIHDSQAPVPDKPAPDPGNTDPSTLTAPLDDDDDVYDRVRQLQRPETPGGMGR